MSNLPPKLAEILATLASADEELKMELLIEFAERFKEVPERIAKRPYAKTHLVPGCESEAYVWAEKLAGEGIKFYFAVENPQGLSAKSFAAILDEGLSGESLANIQQVPAEIVYDIYGKNLSMGKGQGLMGMLYSIKTLAQAVAAD